MQEIPVDDDIQFKVITKQNQKTPALLTKTNYPSDCGRHVDTSTPVQQSEDHVKTDVSLDHEGEMFR